MNALLVCEPGHGGTPLCSALLACEIMLTYGVFNSASMPCYNTVDRGVQWGDAIKSRTVGE